MKARACLTAMTASVIALLTAPPTLAGTVSVSTEDYPELGVLAKLQLTAGPGETNVIQASGSPGAVTVRDAGAALSAAEGCAAGDGGAVVCAHDDFLSLGFDLGDGDDSLTISGVTADTRVDAGDGADVVRTGDGADTIDGGTGTDQLFAAGGGSPTASLSGDTIVYERTADVVVDLTRGRGGVAGENDTLSGFEIALTGSGDDRVTGTVVANWLASGRGDDVISGLAGGDDLHGEAGDDTIIGGAGNDEIIGGSGADRLRGGAGNDRIDAVDVPARGDRVSCGGGRDTVTVDRLDRVSGCERVRRG